MNRQSDPAYPLQHSGCVLVCALGPGLFEDLEQARVLRPNAPIIVVNMAAKRLKGFAIFSMHPDRMRLFANEQRKRFGDDFTTHTGKLSYNPRKHPGVDYWWKGSAGRGTSGWQAARLADLMGFDEIILCGVPLIPGGYADGTPTKLMHKPKVINFYKPQIERDTDLHHKVRSMSGWTRDLLGAPE